jgi:hypothetical protein
VYLLSRGKRVFAVILNAVKDPEEFHSSQSLEPSTHVFAVAFRTKALRNRLLRQHAKESQTPAHFSPPHKQPPTHHNPPSTNHKFTTKKPHKKRTTPTKIATSTIANI